MKFGPIIFMVLVASVMSLHPTAASAAEPVCVTKSNVTLRKGPGTKFPVSWAVPKYMPFLSLERKGAWLKVQDLDGQIHWVRSNAVSSKVSCAVVKIKTAKLRQGPGVDKPLAELSTASKYTSFLRVDRDGEWIQVKDDFEGKSWIHETNVWIPTVRAKVSF